MPSSKKAYLTMLALADEANINTIIDLGSGWGNFIIAMAQKAPAKEIIGYELSILPWLYTKALIKFYRINNITLYRQDFYQVKLPKSAVLVCYLYPQAMQKLAEKLTLKNDISGYLISNNFALPSWQPCKTLRLDDFYNSPIYLYKLAPESNA